MNNNKKGQQMTLGTIVAIVLGLVVLVFLIYGFSTGWGNLWDRVTILGAGDVNVDALSTACTAVCLQENQQAYCLQTRKVTLNAGDEPVVATCKAMADTNVVDVCEKDSICKGLTVAEITKNDGYVDAINLALNRPGVATL